MTCICVAFSLIHNLGGLSSGAPYFTRQRADYLLGNVDTGYGYVDSILYANFPSDPAK